MIRRGYFKAKERVLRVRKGSPWTVGGILWAELGRLRGLEVGQMKRD